MKVLYYNNCWFTNVGEAFVDVGGMELTKRIFGPNSKIACVSDMSDYYAINAPYDNSLFIRRKKPIRDVAHMTEYLNADYVVLPGMMGTLEYLNSPGRKMVDALVAKGCKAVFLGLGGIDYDDVEKKELIKYFSQIKPALITTRDDDVYEFYKDFVPCVRGVDCAFWTIDVFNPSGFCEKDYNVVTFNRIDEPNELHDMENVIRPWHMQYSYRKGQGGESFMISDTPYDYLTLYANAKKVYTDLVHATIVSLMYGTPVRFYKNGTRYRAFYALDDLKDDNGWLSILPVSLEKQKKRIEIEAKMKCL